MACNVGYYLGVIFRFSDEHACHSAKGVYFATLTVAFRM